MTFRTTFFAVGGSRRERLLAVSPLVCGAAAVIAVVAGALRGSATIGQGFAVAGAFLLLAGVLPALAWNPFRTGDPSVAALGWGRLILWSSLRGGMAAVVVGLAFALVAVTLGLSGKGIDDGAVLPVVLLLTGIVVEVIGVMLAAVVIWPIVLLVERMRSGGAAVSSLVLWLSLVAPTAIAFAACVVWAVGLGASGKARGAGELWEALTGIGLPAAGSVPAWAARVLGVAFVAEIVLYLRSLRRRRGRASSGEPGEGDRGES